MQRQKRCLGAPRKPCHWCRRDARGRAPTDASLSGSSPRIWTQAHPGRAGPRHPTNEGPDPRRTSPGSRSEPARMPAAQKAEAAAPTARRPPQPQAGQPQGRGRKSGTSRRTERRLARLPTVLGLGPVRQPQSGTSVEPTGGATGTLADPDSWSTHLLC